MLYQADLRCFVVIWRHHEYTVGVAAQSTARKSESLCCVIATDSGDDFHTSVVAPAGKFNKLFMLVAAHRCILARSSADNYGGCSAVVLKVNKLCHFVIVNAVFVKRSYNRGA